MKRNILPSGFFAMIVIAAFVFIYGCSSNPSGDNTSGKLKGHVMLAHGPVSGSTVTLFAAGTGAPTQLDQVTTDENGAFTIKTKHASADSVFYLVAKGGTPKAMPGKGSNDAIALVTLLGEEFPDSVAINELTTVASAFTAARFISNGAISGNMLGLKIAAGNVPNLVDPATGTWGKVLLDPINSTQTLTLSNLNTLGSLIAACGTTASDDWKARFFNTSTPYGGTTPANTFDAIAGIARVPWNKPAELYALFDEAYPQPPDGSRRAAPYVPYLLWPPQDFVISLCFSGGGTYANGRFMFDAKGNLWSGQNWMPGSQSGVNRSIGGGVTKFSPNGTPLSPPITGFTGMGLDGVGWGTAVTLSNVWATSFNGKILVMDFDGNPVCSESDFPFKEKFLGLMGVGVSEKGDVWVADGADNQLLYFPGGRIKDGKIVKVAGLMSPFDIVIDSRDRIWVSNSQSETVVMFPASDPTKVTTYRCGISVRALALDSKENVWVVSNTSLDFPMPKVPSGASIMEQFKIMGQAMLTYPKSTGVAHLILADGTMADPKGFTGGGAVDIPWGVNIDGNDDVWIGNLGPKSRSVVLMAGANPKGYPEGTKPGDVIHLFKSGSIQMLTDVSIDPAGNVWAANNWNSPEAAVMPNPPATISTWGGGSNLTVIYGVAAPVQGPRMGKVKPL